MSSSISERWLGNLQRLFETKKSPCGEALFTHETKPVVICGDVKRGGYQALQSNEKFGEDAFALSADRRSFIVCDGLGSFGKSGIVARELSRLLLSPKPLKNIFSTKEKPSNQITTQELSVAGRNILSFALENINIGDEFNKPATKPNLSVENSLIGLTTLTILHLGDDGHWYSLVIGDSPLYYKSSREKKWQGIGNDTIGQLGTACLGIKNGGIDVPNYLWVTKFPQDPTLQFVLATDWLSDNWEAASQDFAKVMVVLLQEELKTARILQVCYSDPIRRLGKKPFNPAYELLMQGKIDFYKTQSETCDTFDPWVFANIADAQKLSELARGEGPWWSGKEFKKRDDFTAILVDPSKL